MSRNMSSAGYGGNQRSASAQHSYGSQFGGRPVPQQYGQFDGNQSMNRSVSAQSGRSNVGEQRVVKGYKHHMLAMGFVPQQTRRRTASNEELSSGARRCQSGSLRCRSQSPMNSGAGSRRWQSGSLEGRSQSPMPSSRMLPSGAGARRCRSENIQCQSFTQRPSSRLQSNPSDPNQVHIEQFLNVPRGQEQSGFGPFPPTPGNRSRQSSRFGNNDQY